MLSRNGKKNGDGSFNMKDALIDASIMAGVAFFATLGGVAIVIAPNPVLTVVAAAVVVAPVVVVP